MEENKIVCTCLDITVGDLKKAVENGATTSEEVMEITGAGSVCGACIDEVKSVVEELLSAK